MDSVVRMDTQFGNGPAEIFIKEHGKTGRNTVGAVIIGGMAGRKVTPTEML